MATAVLPAQDCLVRYPPSEEHVISLSFCRHGGRRRSQCLHTGPKSREVSAHLFPNANTSGYLSPPKAQAKGSPFSRNYVLASAPPDQKRSLKSQVPDDYQPELFRKNVNSDGRIYIKSSSNNNNDNVEGPKKGSPDDRCKGGRSLVMGQVTILKRGQTAKDVKGISKGVTQLAPPVGRVEGGSGIWRSVSDAVDVSQQSVTDGENYVKGVANCPDFHVLNSEKWAGPAFVNSPSPSCLPFPKFSVKKSVGGIVQVDRYATRDLRRLLGLD